MAKFIITVLLFLAFSTAGENLPNNFFRAMHMVETGGRYGKIVGKQGELGPFQISHAYWLDAVSFDKTIGGKFENCLDYDYSKRVVFAYLNKNAKNFILAKNIQALARIHNGGKLGYRNRSTKPYWYKFKGYLN